MNSPDWLKPGVYGFAIGAAVLGIVGFTWGGWVTGGTAHERAMSMSRDDVVSAMVPVCLDLARVDPERTAMMAEIRDASTFQRRTMVMDAGWATMPGADTPDRDLARACVAALDVDGLADLPETAVDGG